MAYQCQILYHLLLLNGWFIFANHPIRMLTERWEATQPISFPLVKGSQSLNGCPFVMIKKCHTHLNFKNIALVLVYLLGCSCTFF
jgi:hypothetical protein